MQILPPASRPIKVGDTTIAELWTGNVDTWCVSDFRENFDLLEMIELLKAFAAGENYQITKIIYSAAYARLDVKVEGMVE